MEEHIFFENGKITITKNQFIVDKQSFAMNSITAIKITEKPPSARLSGNTAIVGSLFLFLDGLFFFIGLIMLVIAGLLWKNTKPHYSIILTTPSGELLALTSQEKEYIEKIFAALNQALLSRA
jgi:hypothetical protein